VPIFVKGTGDAPTEEVTWKSELAILTGLDVEESTTEAVIVVVRVAKPEIGEGGFMLIDIVESAEIFTEKLEEVGL
jgi:hypothetical protein